MLRRILFHEDEDESKYEDESKRILLRDLNRKYKDYSESFHILQGKNKLNSKI